MDVVLKRTDEDYRRGRERERENERRQVFSYRHIDVSDLVDKHRNLIESARNKRRTRGRERPSRSRWKLSTRRLRSSRRAGNQSDEGICPRAPNLTRDKPMEERERPGLSPTDDPALVDLRMNDKRKCSRRSADDDLRSISIDSDLVDENHSSRSKQHQPVGLTSAPSNVINFNSNARCRTVDVT
jgi:hypothetical protein